LLDERLRHASQCGRRFRIVVALPDDAAFGEFRAAPFTSSGFGEAFS
jgi:hypothetical protein